MFKITSTSFLTKAIIIPVLLLFFIAGCSSSSNDELNIPTGDEANTVAFTEGNKSYSIDVTSHVDAIVDQDSIAISEVSRVEQTNRPAGYTFPDGLLSFTIENLNPNGGDTINVVLTFPTTYSSDAKYFKVSDAGFEEFSGAVFNGNQVTLTLTDNGSGDLDNVLGQITDPGGPAIPVENNPDSIDGDSDGYSEEQGDCNDNDATIYPGAEEVCDDDIDQDCSGNDSICLTTWYRDSDDDGFGDPNDYTSANFQPPGYVENNTDCDDKNASVHPGATETGNNLDDNCDGATDEGYRFTDIGDGTVRDNDSGLIWLKNANAIGPVEALFSSVQVNNLSSGEHGLTDGSVDGDWRSPTKAEWEVFISSVFNYPALVNTKGDDQWSEGDAFIGVLNGWYWTKTATLSGELWEMNMGTGRFVSIPIRCKDCGEAYIWPVRPETITDSLGMTFSHIPSGTFTMGSPDEEPRESEIYDTDETQHQVTLTQSFYMKRTEVTQAQWEAVMGSNPSANSRCANCPVENVSWNDIQDFITALNSIGKGTYSLPTEAQWEYAARADSTTAFPSGNVDPYNNIMAECNYDVRLNRIGWYCYNSGDTTHEVAQKKSNNWGLYDMSGNVWEWCQDWYGEYPSTSVTDPTGPLSSSDRVIRGGSYNGFAASGRSANRWWRDPDSRTRSIGFRLVLQP